MAAPNADVRRRHGRLGWLALAASFVLFAVIALLSMETGLHGDPRFVNPDPPHAQRPGFLGVGNWPLVTSVMSMVITIGFFGVVGWWSIRERRPHWALIVGIAALCAGALDPLANWATFAVFDPRVAHFPLSWPYFNASPLLEPTLSFLGGYASYYVLTGVGLLSIHRRVVAPRLSPDTGHRLLAVFATGFVIGLPMNAVMQFLWLKVDLFVYTQAAGPVLDIAGRQLPLYMVIYDSFLFAVVAVLCVPDDRGRPAVVAEIVERFGGRPSAARLLAVTTVVLMTAVAVPIAVFSLLRVGGLATPSYDVYPYPTVKVYDPYGDLERAGKPGPFYP
jgi:hypothetical protein